MINFAFMQSTIGLVAATRMELDPLLHKGLPDHIKTCITGVGSVPATFKLLQFIQQEKPRFLLQAGIAGAFDPNIPLSSFFWIEKDRFADLGVRENNEWIDLFDLKLADANEKPFTQGWLINDVTASFLDPDQKATAITVNEITTHEETIHSWKTKYAPALESLEGAAFHYVCLQMGVPFLQIRTVSNYVGERDKNKWEIEKALLHLNLKLADLHPLIAKKYST